MALVVTVVAWGSYLLLKNYEIFTTLFTLQVIVPSQTSFHAANAIAAAAEDAKGANGADSTDTKKIKPAAKRAKGKGREKEKDEGEDDAALAAVGGGQVGASHRWWWWASTGCILAGKGLWEVERALHRSGKCPTSASSWVSEQFQGVGR